MQREAGILIFECHLILLDKDTQNNPANLEYRFWQIGCHDYPRRTVGIVLCPRFSAGLPFRILIRQHYSQGFGFNTFHFSNFGLHECNAAIAIRFIRLHDDL